MLATYCDNRSTDKNTTHSYIELYETLFRTKVNSATHILEIGIGPNTNYGGSILMWANYFQNAQIHAMDIVSIGHVRTELTNHPRIHLYTSTDAYKQHVVDSNFISKDIQFDIMIDDGPHTLESMVNFIKLYSKLLKRDGILVIEDVQDISWIDTLKKVTPLELNPFIEVYDRRHVKRRYDDILFVINKSADAKC
jgi:cephalosporin hydroxylase